MANYYSTELGGSANQTSIPTGRKPNGTVYNARLKRLRGTFTLNTQTTSDTLTVGTIPSGATFAFGVLTTDTSLGTSTISIGPSSSTAKYRAAATFTATDTPTFFGKAAQVGASDPGLSADETVIVTIATASLPASGTFVVDLYYSIAN